MNWPQSVFIQGGKLYVADQGSNRILVWKSIPTLSGQPADYAIGQPDLTSGGTVLNANGFAMVTELWTDGIKLFSTSPYFNRVLVSPVP